LGNNSAITGMKLRTIALWARADAFNNGGLFFTGATGSAGSDFSIRTLTDDNKWRAQIWSNTRDFTLPNSKGQWHHFALVYDGTQLSFYYDGALQDTWAATLDTKPGAIKLGEWSGNKLQGQLDEVSVWNTALTTDQVRKLMHHPLAGNETALLYYASFDNFGPQVYEAVNLQEIAISNGPTKVATTIPVGPGATDTLTESAAGFTSGGATFAYNQQNNATLAISSITLSNYNKHGLPEAYTPLANGYWIGHRYGTGQLDMNVTLQADLPLDGLDPARIVLMGKQPYSDGKWDSVTVASSIDATQQTITFNNLKDYTQLLPVYIDSSAAAITKATNPLPVTRVVQPAANDTVAHSALYADMKNASAFPNPTSGSFYVILPKTAYHSGMLKVLDSKGIPVYMQTLKGNTSTQQKVDISAQPPGIYFIQLIIDSQVVTLKMIRL